MSLTEPDRHVAHGLLKALARRLAQLGGPRPARRLPRRLRAALDAHFDAAFYRAAYPDVAASGTDPLGHYLAHGWREGRDPAPGFSTAGYLAAYPGAAAAREAPLLHYLREGKARGCKPNPFGGDGLSDAEAAVLREAFDAGYYRDRYPDIAGSGLEPLRHFLERGWGEGRDPSPDFATTWYCDTHPEVRAEGVNPFVHWVLYGRARGRPGRPDAPADAPDPAGLARLRAAFDAAHYLEANPDIAARQIDPFLHFMAHGWREGRDPAPDFDIAFYLEANPDIRDAGCNPFRHWVLHGRAEGRPGCRPAPPPRRRTGWKSHSAADLAAISGRFDTEFYLAEHPELARQGIDPAIHYLVEGWRLGFDPRADFSTRFYLECNPDIRASGINPFVHYVKFGEAERRETQSYVALSRRGFRPRVSVIVPNYNHARFLPQRLASIAAQGYDNIELIVLDDKSTDDSRAVIRATLKKLKLKARLVCNRKNSGNVFAQWRKGLELATGELVWICESDDFCAPDFLETLVPAFADLSVNIAFGRIQFADAEGRPQPGLDAYRESAEPGIWEAPLTRPAREWFDGGFGVNNMIANVGGCLFRRMDLPAEVWETARQFRICGDWYLYLKIAGAGQIAYHPEAVAYFRQHGENTSASNFGEKYYYDENIRILGELVRAWGIAPQTRRRFLGKVEAQYRHFGLERKLGPLGTVWDTGALMRAERERLHVQLHFLGFHTGGGELFPINLANALLEAGHDVSMLASDLSAQNPDMRARLDRRIPVYHSHDISRRGRAGFLEAAGVSVINSHVACCDAFLANSDPAPVERPYVVTLHGSYAGFEDAPPAMLGWILRNVDAWIYTADRNLEFFAGRKFDRSRLVKLPNAMPQDCRPAPFTRAGLGIGAGDVVFTLVARGIKRKGWRAAVAAFRRLREAHGRDDTHLLLIGEGAATEAAQAQADGLAGVHFLGYRSEINGILRLSDCLILPSRFEGESYPLCLIQALQEARPVIATDIGEVRSMLSGAGRPAGILLANQRDSAAYFDALSAAMLEMCDPAQRARYAARAAERGAAFDMGKLVARYEAVYREASGAPTAGTLPVRMRGRA